MAQPEIDTLDQLQTSQQVELLDKIDELHNQGLGHHGISLPQLIVCGDQSSGKSSLLEGLTRLRFPTKDSFCTAFATEVVLRKETHAEISCTITPGKKRSLTERRGPEKFRHTSGNDTECQRVFRYLKTFDPAYSRTLGIITKPDRIDRGSDREQEIIRLMKNKQSPLKHQWHAVRNRGFATKDHTDAERDDTECEFFSTGAWASLPSQDVGITTFRVKLSRVLLENIGGELPSLVSAVQNAISTTVSGLKALYIARNTTRQQRSYLTGHAEKFQKLNNDALRGNLQQSFPRILLARQDHDSQTAN